MWEWVSVGAAVVNLAAISVAYFAIRKTRSRE